MKPGGKPGSQPRYAYKGMQAMSNVRVLDIADRPSTNAALSVASANVAAQISAT